MATAPTKTAAPTAPTGYYTEGNVVNGVNVGGGSYVQGTPPASYNNAVQQTLSGTGVSYNPSTGLGESVNSNPLTPPAPINPNPQMPPDLNNPTSQPAQPQSTSVTSPNQSLQTPISQGTSPQMGQPQTPPQEQVGQKYTQAFNQAQNQGTAAPQTPGQGRAMVNDATQSYQAPQGPYQPSPQFMTVGDPIMQTFVQSALGYQQEVVDTGYTAKRLQTQFASSIKGIDLDAANIQNIMNGTRDDIRAEIGKAGGFATESQVEGLVTTRNRDLLKQYNNIELQKQTMESQMSLQVGLAQADHQYATDKYNEVLQTANLYKGIYTNATDQVDKLVQNVGYTGLAAAYNNDPYALSLAEQHLSMPQGTLSNPQSLNQLETYRQKTLNLTNARFAATYGFPAPNGNAPLGSMPSSNPTGNPTIPGGGEHPVSNPDVSYAQYGLLTNTNFNPKDTNDQTALNYLNVYLNNGEVPNATGIGLRGVGNIVSTKFQNAQTRANDLYYAATGENLPPPEIIKNNIGLISANNKLSNNLKIQENTVNANFGLSLQNLNANNINSAYPILNGVINNIKNAEGDPAVAQYMAQNSTIQQELGNLLAVKNASGTTVYDKIAGAGLLPKNATPAQQVQVVKTLLQEAKNASNAFKQVNGELYSSVDPLQRQKDNPNRQNYLNAQVPSNWVTMSGPKGTFKVDPKNVDVMKQNGYK